MTTNAPFLGMTNKHLASLVRFGRYTTFLTPELADDIAGYVCGFDDDNVRIAVITGDEVEVRLRHRRYIAGVDEDKSRTIAKEPVQLREKIEPLVKGFRKRITEEYFPQHATSPRED